jgi:hypothetical protein
MEPLPETESLEEFQPTPLPSLRMPSSSLLAPPDFHDSGRKPPTLRRSTDPAPSSPVSPIWGGSVLPYRPRTTSPLSAGSHVRSKSTASLAPPMIRTQSMPGVNGAGHLLYSPQVRAQSPSPSASPNRVRLPRRSVDESFPTSPTRASVLDPDRRVSERTSSPSLAVMPSALSRHRRPSSPLRHYIAPNTTPGSAANPATISPGPITPSPAATSPSYRASDPLVTSSPFFTGYVSSSVPSTPTSARSRSPSISSLETIPDSPDAEEAALEAERTAQLQAAADANDGGESKDKVSATDVPVRGRTLSFGSRDKRKRWSVCGAERRGDLDLETIWED